MEEQLSGIIKATSFKSHQKLEKKIIELLKEIKTEEDYCNLLGLFYNYFNTLENKIHTFLSSDMLPDYPKRRKTQLIKNDVLDIGFSLPELRNIKLPAITNALEAMAALYVMEGSTLGGSFIVKMLERKGICQGISFFSGYGSDTGSMWQIFLKALNDIPLVSGDERIHASEIVTETFDYFFDFISCSPISARH